MILNLFANPEISKLTLPERQTRSSGGRYLEVHSNLNACAKVFNEL